VAEALQCAALGLSGWDRALGVLAHATGAKSGELVGLGRTPFQVITEISDEEMADFTAANGHDPAVSSRVRAGMRAPLLQLLDEADFDTVGDTRRSLAYGDVISRLDIPFAQIVILHRSPEVTLGLSILRTARSGGMPGEEKRLLAAAAGQPTTEHVECHRRRLGMSALGRERTVA